jgi:hypothetical protein
MPKKLEDKLDKYKIKELYRSGKKTFTIDGVRFKIERGGPGNNFINVSPVSKSRLTPVFNFAYDERVEEQRTAVKVAARSMGKIPKPPMLKQVPRA